MHDPLIWTIAALTIAGVLFRPRELPEWVFALLGSTALLATTLVSPTEALTAVSHGLDVYFFLTGMMLLSELAREEGLFDWLAFHVTRKAGQSSQKLFFLVYTAGIFVTMFMSNDATAVVLTPAIYNCAKTAGAKPKPYLFACALIANAASFLLPISNPANLVMYGNNLPGLFDWLKAFLVPSIASIVMTYLVLIVWFKKDLSQKLETRGGSRTTPNSSLSSSLSSTGKWVFTALGVTAAVLILCSTFKVDLGFPTFLLGIITLALVSLRKQALPLETVKSVSWGVLPLVAGLFVVIEAVNRAQVLKAVHGLFVEFSENVSDFAKLAAAFSVAAASNIANNLPVGLTSGLAVQGDEVSEVIRRAVLIGVDLGPNLSVTGSLATVLWLIVLRREKERVSAWEFFKLGMVVMPLSLIAAILCS